MSSRIIIASRSILASNVYKLLLSSCNSEIISTQRFETARPLFFRNNKIDLAIFHSDIFTPRFDGYLKRLTDDEPFKKIWKIFVCKSSPREKEWQKQLRLLPKSYVIERPFSIDDFNSLISGVVNVK